MCLIASHVKIRRAKTDLVCYKVLDKKTKKSPFQEIEFTGIPEEYDFKIVAIWPNNKITKGFIHVYATMNRALEIKQKLEESGVKHLEIFRAYIPKGTLYWEGVEDDYASRKVILK